MLSHKYQMHLQSRDKMNGYIQNLLCPPQPPTPTQWSPAFRGGVWFSHRARAGGGVDGVAAVCDS